jgi:hypothetical protein
MMVMMMVVMMVMRTRWLMIKMMMLYNVLMRSIVWSRMERESIAIREITSILAIEESKAVTSVCNISCR